MTDALERSQRKRTRIARIVLLGTGLYALALFFVVPLLRPLPFYRGVVQPAFDVLPAASEAQLEALPESQQRLLAALHLDAAIRDGQGPLPLMAGSEGVDTADLTPYESLLLGREMAQQANELDKLRSQTAVLARFLVVSSALYGIVGLLCFGFALSPWPGVGSRSAMVVAGASSLWLLVTHAFTLGFDLLGVADERLFAIPLHPLTTFVVVAVGIGTALPLARKNALFTVLGTLATFVLGGLVLGAWVLAA